MNIKGAIFDADGTLFDSMYVWDRVANDYLISIGITPPDDYRDALRNLCLRQSAEYTKNRFGLELTIDEIMNGINKQIENAYFNEIPLKDGVAEFLERLYNCNIKMCIATATDRYLVEAALKRCNISQYFYEIFTCTDIGFGKDNPKIYNTALEHLGTPKENTLIFEDALFAVETAKAAGFTTVAIFDAAQTNQDELKKLSDYYITSFKEAII